MEDGLWHLWQKPMQKTIVCVLILVLMEDGLWLILRFKRSNGKYRLNPCFNGRWSLTNPTDQKPQKETGLNPCFNGRWSLTSQMYNRYENKMGCLNPCFNGRWSLTCLWNQYLPQWKISLNPCFNGRWSLTSTSEQYGESYIGLNPCFNGRWSLTFSKEILSVKGLVLILVLMEDGLWLWQLLDLYFRD